MYSISGVNEHMKICILMYTLNGVNYLGEQLQSIFKQDIYDKAEISILVRDDGSTDRTTDILDRYQNDGKLTWFSGEALGKTKAYWELIEKAGDADYYALCEQDDVWYPEKLSRAVKYLETKAIIDGEETEVSKRAMLYLSGYTVTNAKLKPMSFRRNPSNKYTDFEHSLVFSSMPGCTYVFNGAARENLLKYDTKMHYTPNYENLVRNIIFITGTVVFDRVTTVYWRRTRPDKQGPMYQGGLLGHIKMMLELYTGKVKNERSKMAAALLEVFKDELDESVKAEPLKQLSGYIEDAITRERLLQNHKFATGSFPDKWFKSAVKGNKL